MTLAHPHLAVMGRVKTRLELGGDGGAPIFTRYPDDNRQEPATGPWLFANLVEGNREPITIGEPALARSPAFLYLDFYRAPLGKGVSDLLALAERGRVAFQRVTLATPGTAQVRFETPEFGAGGSSGQREGKWWRVQLVCPFYVDDQD